MARLVDVYGVQTQGNDHTWTMIVTVSTFRDEPGQGDSGEFIEDAEGAPKVWSF